MKNNRPLSDFIWLNELDFCKGLLASSKTAYDNPHSAADFLGMIASVERENIVNLVRKADFFSLTMDGSTDKGTIEQETLFVRSSHKGRLHEKFLCVGEPQSACSEHLFDFVIETLKALEIYAEMGKCVGFGSDGASNMTWKRKGLVTLLKKLFPQIFGIHCLGHRLELSFKDALAKTPVVQQTSHTTDCLVLFLQEES